MEQLDQKFRELITDRCGGKNFDAPGGGYTFSAVLAEEEELKQTNIVGNTKSALLCLSVGDPVGKMPLEAGTKGFVSFCLDPETSRYTDLRGPKICEAADFFVLANEQLAGYLERRYGCIINKDWVQWSPGGIKRSLAEYIPTTFFDENTQVVFPSPGYGVIVSPKNIRGATKTETPMFFDGNLWSIIFDNIPLMDKKRWMYLNIPQNPTAMSLDEKSWQYVISWAKKNSVMLVVDEAYIDLCFDEKSTSILTVPGWEECAIVLQSVSKGYNATGLRFGWMIGHPTLIKALRETMDVKDSGMFGPSIVSGLECLRHPEWARETKNRYFELHQLLANVLNIAGFETRVPSAGLFQLTKAPVAATPIGGERTEFKSSAECAQWLRKTLRISTMHASAADQNFIRWAVTIPAAPNCGINNEFDAIHEAGRRLQGVEFEF